MASSGVKAELAVISNSIMQNIVNEANFKGVVFG